MLSLDTRCSVYISSEPYPCVEDRWDCGFELRDSVGLLVDQYRRLEVTVDA